MKNKPASVLDNSNLRSSACGKMNTGLGGAGFARRIAGKYGIARRTGYSSALIWRRRVPRETAASLISPGRSGLWITQRLQLCFNLFFRIEQAGNAYPTGSWERARATVIRERWWQGTRRKRGLSLVHPVIQSGMAAQPLPHSLHTVNLIPQAVIHRGQFKGRLSPKQSREKTAQAGIIVPERRPVGLFDYLKPASLVPPIPGRASAGGIHFEQLIWRLGSPGSAGWGDRWVDPPGIHHRFNGIPFVETPWLVFPERIGRPPAIRMARNQPLESSISSEAGPSPMLSGPIPAWREPLSGLDSPLHRPGLRLRTGPTGGRICLIYHNHLYRQMTGIEFYPSGSRERARATVIRERWWQGTRRERGFSLVHPVTQSGMAAQPLPQSLHTVNLIPQAVIHRSRFKGRPSPKQSWEKTAQAEIIVPERRSVGFSDYLKTASLVPRIPGRALAGGIHFGQVILRLGSPGSAGWGDRWVDPPGIHHRFNGIPFVETPWLVFAERIGRPPAVRMARNQPVESSISMEAGPFTPMLSRPIPARREPLSGLDSPLHRPGLRLRTGPTGGRMSRIHLICHNHLYRQRAGIEFYPFMETDSLMSLPLRGGSIPAFEAPVPRKWTLPGGLIPRPIIHSKHIYHNGIYRPIAKKGWVETALLMNGRIINPARTGCQEKTLKALLNRGEPLTEASSPERTGRPIEARIIEKRPGGPHFVLAGGRPKLLPNQGESFPALEAPARRGRAGRRISFFESGGVHGKSRNTGNDAISIHRFDMAGIFLNQEKNGLMGYRPFLASRVRNHAGGRISRIQEIYHNNQVSRGTAGAIPGDRVLSPKAEAVKVRETCQETKLLPTKQSYHYPGYRRMAGAGLVERAQTPGTLQHAPVFSRVAPERAGVQIRAQRIYLQTVRPSQVVEGPKTLAESAPVFGAGLVRWLGRNLAPQGVEYPLTGDSQALFQGMPPLIFSHHSGRSPKIPAAWSMDRAPGSRPPEIAVEPTELVARKTMEGTQGWPAAGDHGREDWPRVPTFSGPAVLREDAAKPKSSREMRQIAEAVYDILQNKLKVELDRRGVL